MERFRNLVRRFKNTTFRRQLTVVSAVGVMSVSLLSALATSWQSSRQLRANKLQEGTHIARNLAAQSRLALVFDSRENVSEAMAAASAFPDVVRIEIRRADGSLLVAQGKEVADQPARDTPARPGTEALLEAETGSGWRFTAPVWAAAGPQSPFETTERKEELLGFVRIDQSKATLDQLVAEVFFVNFAAGLAFTGLFLFALRILSHRLTRPLSQLSGTMARAEAGESGLRADLAGPRDLADMAKAFNSMMVALEQREQELRTTRDSALRFAKLKADFAATVSHEIRTPLNGVIGTLDLLKMEQLSADQRELLDLAWQSSQYLLELINNILDFSRLEAGRLEADACDFELKPMVDGVMAMFASLAAGKRLQLDATIAADVPPALNGDSPRIRQVLINLIGNALKFTERGAVALTVDRIHQGSFVRFSVHDTGIGVPAEHQAAIFDSFTQADTSTTRRYGGSGLGLAICKQIVRLLGGEIGVDSTPGHGSTFWFSVPCVVGALHPLAAPANEPLVVRGGRILIAEDNQTNQLVASGMLRLLGCSCRVATNGVEAVAAWQEGPWDLILMDCSMPEMDGFQATATIRSLEAETARHIPIIAMTANTQPADVEMCLAAGMDDHLPKPLTLEALAERLERWLDWEAPRRQPGAAAGEAAEPPVDIPLDRGVLERLRDVLGPALGEAIRPFLEDMPGYLRKLQSAAAGRDARTLAQIAHVVKGAAGNLGAVQVAAIAKDIEYHAEAGDVDSAAELLLRLRTEHALLEPLLTGELDQVRSGQATPEESEAPVVLIVDDDRSTRAALRHALNRSGFVVEEAGNGAEAIAWMERHTPDAVLMDARMPVMDGFAACAALKNNPLWQDIPVLMITALEDRASIEKAFDAGASDFIPKPIHLSVVNQRVRRVINATRAERHVRHLAYNDPLTGLANRRLFIENTERALERAHGAKSLLALLFLDLDRFKYVNDTLGHELGDQLLVTVAQRIRNCVRSDDCVARLGGDEFTILLDDLPKPEVAASVAQSICRGLAAPMELGGQELVVTASIGIALFPGDGQDVNTLLRRADTAMYRAKQTGNGCYYYEAAMESVLSKRLKMENELRHALDKDEITVFYQPVMDAPSQKISGFEALVRWRHPQRGIVSPAEFIELAEETGLIVPLGEQVLNMACQQAKTWLDAGAEDFRIAVNLSGKQLELPDLPEIVTRALEASRLPAGNLVLEITESVLMERARDPAALLNRLRALGVMLAIDDFGTGYSSLSYLKRFPLDFLKIDRSFIQDMTTNPDAQAIVTGIVALAHSLRLKVTAEGVETAAQRDALAAIECDYLQGFLYSRPVPADVVETVLLLNPSRAKAHQKPQRSSAPGTGPR